MKRILCIAFVVMAFIATCTVNAQPKLTVDVSQKGVAVSPTHYGIFFEDINHAADGGLYAELIRNRSFEDATTLDYWGLANQTGASATMSAETTNLLNSSQTQALKLSITQASATARAGVYNTGFWGINVVNGQKYTVTFFAKCDASFTGTVTASLESSTGVKYAQATVSGLNAGWQKFTCTLTATGGNSAGRFVLSTNSTGTLWFDVVSVFPPTFNNRANGLRPDLAQMLADLHPKFMRFPGGCFVEGDYLANRYQWKKSMGNIEVRPGHYNLWGYRTSDGMGFHEFLQLAEDIGAIPLYVTNIGVSHNDYQPYTDLSGYIQDALDALEYANGDVTTTYGAMRAANGHPAPFNIQYIEIGNENSWGDNYNNRFALFYNAIKAKYPNIQCIADGTVPTTTQFVDEHYYSSPQWFIDQYNKYDTYSRTGSKVYVGEYAVTSDCGTGNLNAAIGEAAYMCGMEKNTDVVGLCSYAPIFVNTNDRKWNPDMIVYNASASYGTPSYYVQKMFANNMGTVTIPVKDTLNQIMTPIDGTGQVGLGTWATQSDYSNVTVTNSKGATLISEPFASTANWAPGTGTWSLSGGIYSQTSSLTDCRSIDKTSITDSTYTISLKARKTGGNEGFLIIFGYKDSNDFYWWNIGGWGNTQHAIEHCVGGSKTVLVPVSGSISTNIWYDVRIEVSPTKVLCYLNNVLIHTLNASTTLKLYTSATLDETTNQLFLKVVNPSTSDCRTAINLKNATATRISGTASVLTSVGLYDENSFTSPNYIVPVNSAIDTLGSALNYTFKANSVTVLKLSTSNTSGVSQVKANSKKLSIYPNPTKDFVYFKDADAEPISYQVRNITGQTVLQNKALNGKADLSALQPGIYLLTAQQGNQVVSGKVVKE